MFNPKLISGMKFFENPSFNKPQIVYEYSKLGNIL